MQFAAGAPCGPHTGGIEQTLATAASIEPPAVGIGVAGAGDCEAVGASGGAEGLGMAWSGLGSSVGTCTQATDVIYKVYKIMFEVKWRALWQGESVAISALVKLVGSSGMCRLTWPAVLLWPVIGLGGGIF